MVFQATGLSLRWMHDVYHLLLRIRWSVLILGMWVGYLMLNLAFAFLYRWEGNNISGATPGDLWSAYWFSVQTLSTIGYGTMSPTSWGSNMIATVESFIGLVLVALGTGLMFAKFSRPTARVSFSQPILISRRNGRPCLMFRMANERSSHIVEAHLMVSVLQEEVTQEGERMRRFYPLHLEREHTPIFAMSWTAIHPITADSPLHGLSPETLLKRVQSIVVLFTGIDDLFAQSVHARHSYFPADVSFGHRFVDMIETAPSGEMVIHHEKLHLIEPTSPTVAVSPGPGGPSSGS
jgi:inward rectifier potassium channel